MKTTVARTVGVLVSLAFAASVSVSSAVAAAPEPDGADAPSLEYSLPRVGIEEYLNPGTGPLTNDEAIAQAAVLCNFVALADDLHYSSTETSFGTVSVHGRWRNGNCDATKAVVTTQLQKKNRLGLWFDIGTKGVKTVYSDGGSANRSNSRYVCVAHEKNQYRAWVDVDVVGVDDLPNRLYTPAYEFNCD